MKKLDDSIIIGVIGTAAKVTVALAQDDLPVRIQIEDIGLYPESGLLEFSPSMARKLAKALIVAADRIDDIETKPMKPFRVSNG